MTQDPEAPEGGDAAGADGPEEAARKLLQALTGDAPESPAAACAALTEILYDDLRRLARSFLSRERAGHSLSPTDLVHEAYQRLVDQVRVDLQGRSHFLALAAQAMRRLLVDHARHRSRAKRGGDWQRVTFDPGLGNFAAREEMELEELLALDAALAKLEAIDPREARIVELRYFAGMEVHEIATALGVSKRTVDRDWLHARSWLKRELSGGRAPEEE
jgi:RNA polymerase sigma factor (TIGR02999 family)